MPIYEYLCKECELVFEHIHKANESYEAHCLGCSAPMYKIISSGGIYFKGEGWTTKQMRESQE